MNTYLHDHRLFPFEEEDCRIYLKGLPRSAAGPTELDSWTKSLADRLIQGDSQFSAFLSAELVKMSGLFSLVIEKGKDCYIAADRIRSMPVFYGFMEDKLFITNNIHEFQEQNGVLECDSDRIEEFLSASFVLGNGTIFKDVFALQAGEIVSIKDLQVSSERYFEFRPEEKEGLFKNINEFSEALHTSLLTVFSNMIENAPGVNRWLVPLSGGHDSRIIVNYLYRLGQKNVICYTYGTPGNEQSIISKQVAEALGYEWHFVEYSEKKWQALHESGLIDDYINYAFNGVSIPHLQDFLAVHELKEKEIIKQGDVFVPGHTFDWLAGSNFSEADMACTNKQQAIERVLFMHLKSKDFTRFPVRSIEKIYDKASLEPKYFQEYFNWQEKRAKFMANSVRGYEFFNFDYRLPFWDKEISEFWMCIPDNERMGRKIFFEAEEHGVLVDELISVPFARKVDNSGRGFVSKILSKYLPGVVKTQILKYTVRKVKMNEGLNQIYALKAPTVKEILAPVEDFPYQTRPYFEIFLERYPFQMDYHFLTALYSIRKQFDRN